jgi:hypothetical protein
MLNEQQSRPRNMSLNSNTSHNNPPFLLVIPPTPTGSVGVTPSTPSKDLCPSTLKQSFSQGSGFKELVLHKRKTSLGFGTRMPSSGKVRSSRRYYTYSQAVNESPSSSSSSREFEAVEEPKKKRTKFKKLAKHLKITVRKTFARAFNKPTACSMISNKPINVDLPLDLMQKKHRRSSSDPTPAMYCKQANSRILDSVLEESSAGGSSGDAPPRARSDSCLVSGDSSSSMEQAAFFLLTSSSSPSATSVYSQSSRSSDHNLESSAVSLACSGIVESQILPQDAALQLDTTLEKELTAAPHTRKLARAATELKLSSQKFDPLTPTSSRQEYKVEVNFGFEGSL